MVKTKIVWDYIRRNPIFRAGDIVMVTDVKLYTLTAYLSEWMKEGCIILAQDNKPASERIYRLTKKSVTPPALKNSKTKNKELRVLKDLQSAAERAKIRFTHEAVRPKRVKTSAKVKAITLEARLIRGAKGIGYSPTMYSVDKEGNIVCKETGFIVDRVHANTADDSYGFTACKSA